MNAYLIGMPAYCFLLIVVGVYMGQRVRSASDFLVAGRSLNTGLIFATFLAANLGAGSRPTFKSRAASRPEGQGRPPVTGRALQCGHLLPEELPDEVLAGLQRLFA